MTDDNPNAGQPPEPNPDLESLSRLIGTWEMSGNVQGTMTYEWM